MSGKKIEIIFIITVLVIFLSSTPGIADRLITSSKISDNNGPLTLPSISQSPVIRGPVSYGMNITIEPNDSILTDIGVDGIDHSWDKSSTIPTPIAPGSTITDKTPSYKWTKIKGATNYCYQLKQGATTVYTITVTSGTCGTTYCTNTPSKTLSLKAYKWHVRAKIGGVWKSYSPYKSFTVTNPPSNGFNSQFNGNAPGWSVVRGSWNFASGSYYQTAGILDKYSSIVHTNNYPNLDYLAKMKRTGCKYCANGLTIRGTVNPLQTDNKWSKFYLFEYSNDKYFSVWEISSSGHTALKGWTEYTGINTDGWNTLRVTAKGGNLKFYINNAPVWSGSDTTLTTGKVGIMTYRYNDSDTNTDKSIIDWATLSTTVPSSINKQQTEVGAENTGWIDFTRSPEE